MVGAAADDPVNELIERHKAAAVAYTVAVDYPDCANLVRATPEAEDVVGEALDALVDSAEGLLAFQPVKDHPTRSDACKGKKNKKGQ